MHIYLEGHRILKTIPLEQLYVLIIPKNIVKLILNLKIEKKTNYRKKKNDFFN